MRLIPSPQPPLIQRPAFLLTAGTLGPKLLQLATVAAAIHRAQSISQGPRR